MKDHKLWNTASFKFYITFPSLIQLLASVVKSTRPDLVHGLKSEYWFQHTHALLSEHGSNTFPGPLLQEQLLFSSSTQLSSHHCLSQNCRERVNFLPYNVLFCNILSSRLIPVCPFWMQIHDTSSTPGSRVSLITCRKNMQPDIIF